MATLERRIAELERSGGDVEVPKLVAEFIDPQRGLVAVRLWSGEWKKRSDDETEARFSERVRRWEAADAKP